MILRRITEHVKAQNWFAVGIDFFIVVVGVFIGIQVANWNANLSEKRRGDEYVVRLLRDLRSDLSGTQTMVDYYASVREGAYRAVTLLEGTESESKPLVVNAYRASEYYFAPVTRSTWDEIVSSGDIGLLPRNSIENGLAGNFSYDLGLEALQYMRASPYRARVRGLISHGVQEAIRAGCGDIRGVGFSIQLSSDCSLDAPDAEIDEAAAAIRTDPMLLKDLRSHISTINSSFDNLQNRIVVLEQSISILESDDRGRETNQS